MTGKKLILFFMLAALWLGNLSAEEISRVKTVGYVMTIEGKTNYCIRGSPPYTKLSNGMELHSGDQFQVDQGSSVTVIYCDGQVDSLRGLTTWLGTRHVSPEVEDPREQGFLERLALFCKDLKTSRIVEAGARGGETPPPLQLFCATIRPESGSGGWTGELYWSEHGGAASNTVELQFWKDADFVKAVTLDSQLVEKREQLALYRARFEIMGLKTGEITSIQVGDTVRRGLGNSKPLDWNSVWNAKGMMRPAKAGLPGDVAEMDRRLAQDLVMEAQNNPCAALDDYLYLHNLEPKNVTVNSSLVGFFNRSGTKSIAAWYAPSVDTKDGNE